ncbi:hypothetical protein HS088_TW21G01753 [Tripterygium wilfordii]|uniref:Membrane lipoprotein n=1 Tax=Tripterygium wilfordii TaxID=458696 RepID=A0A7J7C748_TRIWF|nr:uncharacterized protein LOC119988771 [Tripterygium wilfordii]KAF5729586.1 hypothetical protein HS088_TW21G01753 [Tripterygium wilfordii]
MKSLSSVGLGLSVVFGCLLLALVAELYYLLWWKKRIPNREIEDDRYSSPAKQLLFMFCWRKPSSLSHTALNPQELCSSVSVTDTLVHDPETQLRNLHSNKDLLLKSYGNNDDDMETELLRLNSLSGPPRFLFTIVEETREDLESEDAKSNSGKGSRGRSLSDLILTVETPYLTPLASPSFFTPPLTPLDTSCKGFNPLFESSTDAEFSRIRSSPPPKFKFLQDAEEKLYKKKLIEEAEKKVNSHGWFPQQEENIASGSKFIKDEEDSSFITIIVDKNKERELKHHHQLPQQYSTGPSQALSLNSSSPTTSI